MKMRVRFPGRPFLAAMLAGTLIAGCSSDDATGPVDPPVPGELSVTVAPTAGSIGALVLHVTGPAITSATAAAGATLYQDLSGGTLRAAVVGSSLTGEVVRISVPDVRDAADYAVTVRQAADNDNQALATSGAVAEVIRTP